MYQVHARADANQKRIVQALRDLGATVQHLHQVGKGCPDLLIGWRGKNLLLEVKAPGGELTLAEREFFERWTGQVAIVRSIDDVVELLAERI